MAQRLKDKPSIWKEKELTNSDFHLLVLHNDEIHSFDFVIESLIEICHHSFVQAEQCTIIAHYKGKCDVKKGIRKDIESMQIALNKQGLISTIE